MSDAQSHDRDAAARTAQGGGGTEIDYVGDELALFAHAHRWKRYIKQKLSPFIGGDVVEVGAGIGTTTTSLIDNPAVSTWTCIEPDRAQAQALDGLLTTAGGKVSRAIVGTLDDAPAGAAYDTILYVDVLEHIEHDREEVAKAYRRLKSGGRLVILVPAWNFLYSPFDKSIGHFRRYTRSSLRRLRHGDFQEEAAFYMDSVGFCASVANKYALKQSMPTQGQVVMWDSYIVPLSRVFDPVLGNFWGKSLVVVWRKP